MVLRPGEPVDIKKLRERWMRFYIDIARLKSYDPTAQKILDEMQLAAGLFNEKVMDFFDKMLRR